MTNDISIAKTARIYGNVQIGRGVKIGDYTVIGVNRSDNRNSPVIIEDYVVIGSHVTIYAGVKIGRLTYVEDYALISEDVQIGERSRILYGAKVYDEAK